MLKQGQLLPNLHVCTSLLHLERRRDSNFMPKCVAQVQLNIFTCLGNSLATPSHVKMWRRQV